MVLTNREVGGANDGGSTQKKGDPKAAFFELRSKHSFGQCLELNAHVNAVKVKIVTFSAVKLCFDALAVGRC